jgi:GTP-binding protein
VGKSTLFNRISGRRRSIVTPIPGTTRDVLAERAEWAGIAFELVDTGGMFGASEDPLHAQVVAQGQRAIEGADLVVVVVDGTDGLVSADEDVAAAARRSGAQVVLAINKIDVRASGGRRTEFDRLGFGDAVEVAAEHGTGVADLLDLIVTRLGDPPPAAAGPGDAEELRLAIIGRPNVGKSSLVNRLLKEERVVVSETPGTTRDAVDAVLRWHGRTLRLVDTAGIRRPGKVARGGPLESLSVLVARRAIERADVAVLVVDASEGATDQDAAVAGEAAQAGCGVVIAANKWDLVKTADQRVAKAFDERLRRQLKFLDYAPVLHVSALTGERTPKLLEAVVRVEAARRARVTTGALNRFVEQISAANPPVSKGHREVRILYAVQSGVAPPTFVFFTNVATSFHFSYERFLQNRLREAFGFEGSPIRLRVRRRAKTRDPA